MPQIRGSQILDGTITGADIQDMTITNADIDPNSPIQASNLDISWLVPVATEAVLPGSATNGDTAVALDSGVIFIRSGGVWTAGAGGSYVSSDFDTDFSTKDTDDLTEGTVNKYFFNHDNTQHTATYITSASVTYEVLDTNGDIGTSAGQVAIGNHTHGAIYYTEAELDAGQLDNRYYTETELTNGTAVVHYNNLTNVPSFITSTGVTYENLSANSDIGTGAAQVSQGDHTHGSIYYTESEIDAAFLQVDGSNSMTGALSAPSIDINTVNPADTATIFGTDSAGDSIMHIRIGNGANDKFQIESWNGSSATSLLEITQSDVNILGNLNVSGTTTTIDSSVLNVTDSDITLNSGQATAVLNASIIADRGSSTDAKIVWNETDDRWQIDSGSGVASNIVSELVGNAPTATTATTAAALTGSQATDITNNTNHSGGDGTDHSGVALPADLLSQDDASRSAYIATGDWNNYTTSGLYVGDTLTNAPTVDWFYVLVQRYDSEYIQQTAWRLTGTFTIIYSRIMDGTTWRSWIELADTTHQDDDGSDHADVASNTSHRNDNSQAHTDYLINNGDDSTTGVLTAPTFKGEVGIPPGAGNGVSFWNSDNYKIYMSATNDGTYGGELSGAATSDYNIYSIISAGTNRGHVWKNDTTILGQLTGEGNLHIKENITTEGDFNLSTDASIQWNANDGSIDFIIN